MDIRRLTEADAPAFRALRLRALAQHPEAFTSDHEEAQARPLEDSRRRLADPQLRFWGAFDGAALCGMVGLERETRAKNRHKATVVAMYVATEAAGRGAGRALLDALLAQARADGIALLVLTVTEGNSRAMQLYERCGFKSFGVEPRAIQIGGRYFSKNHMTFWLGDTS